MGSQDFPKRLRLRKRPEFLRVQRRGRRVVGRFVVVIGRANALGSTRYGLVVSRKVGNSVVRNRVKRWLREVVRRRGARDLPLDVVLIARSRSATAGLEALERDLTSGLARLTKELAV